jgi:predicted SPOUT superfamily RNA methylase MTH1
MAGPARRFFHFAVAIPASITMDIPHLREKTFRIGLIGRAAAIFRVAEIIIYPDLSSASQQRDIALIQTVLSYMETPQYLRKHLFRIVPELQYAGTLPPLRTPHHPTASKMEDLTLNEYREGLAVSYSKEGTLVDVGVEKPVLVPGGRFEKNQRITVKITTLGTRPAAVYVNPEDIKVYWGYRVTVSNLPLGRLLEKRQFDLVVATSKRGSSITQIMDNLRQKWQNSKKTLVAFGAPTQGLYEIVARENLELHRLFDFVVNTIPDQAVETVRTDEAMYVTLAILNTLGS